MTFAKNTGQFHPSVAWVANIQKSPLADSYHGCGDYMVLIDAKGELLEIHQVDIYSHPQPESVPWSSSSDADPRADLRARHALLNDGSTVPAEGIISDGKKAWLKCWGSSYEIGLNHGTAGAALLSALEMLS